MKDSISILLDLTIYDINQSSCKTQKVLNQIKMDLTTIMSSSDDPSKQADHFFKELYTIAKEHEAAFSQASLNKISSLCNLVQDQKSQIDLLSCLYMGIGVVMHFGVEKIETILISKHIDDILYALNTKEPKNTVESCIEFGTFLQKTFPGKRLEYIQKQLGYLKAYKKKIIPQFDLLAAVSETRIVVYEQILNKNCKFEDIIFMDALSKGIAVFSTLMNDEQFITKISRSSDNMSFRVKNDIFQLLPSNAVPSNITSGTKKFNSVKKGLINFFKYPKIGKYFSESFSKAEKSLIFEARKEILSNAGKNKHLLFQSKLEESKSVLPYHHGNELSKTHSIKL